MYITCLDLEGVLVPEIWIAFAEETGIDELRLTTRDISDYDVLMKKRIDILKSKGLKLQDIQDTIKKINPMEGAKSFLDSLRELCQVVILSDTFTEFAQPLMKKLGMPTIFCNSLDISDDGFISDYSLRQNNGKYHAVKGFQSMGFKVVASGDSFNDLEMIKQAEKGFLFRPPKHIQEEHAQFHTFVAYEDLFNAIKKEVQGK